MPGQSQHQLPPLLRRERRHKGDGEIVQRAGGLEPLQSAAGENGVELFHRPQAAEPLLSHRFQPVVEGELRTQVPVDGRLVVEPAEAGLVHDHVKAVLVGGRVVGLQDLHRVGRVLGQGAAPLQQGLEMTVVLLYLVCAPQQHGLGAVL